MEPLSSVVFLEINMCNMKYYMISFLLGLHDMEQCHFNRSKVAARLLKEDILVSFSPLASLSFSSHYLCLTFRCSHRTRWPSFGWLGNSHLHIYTHTHSRGE